MNVWLKRLGYIALGIGLSKLTNLIIFDMLNKPGDGVNLTYALVPTLFSSLVLGIFVFLAYRVKSNSYATNIQNASSYNASNEDYLRAEVEFNSAQRDAGLWVRCFAEADGNEAIAKARYIKSRASQFNSKIQPETKNFVVSNKFKKYWDTFDTFGKLAILSVAGFWIYAVLPTGILKKAVYDVYECDSNQYDCSLGKIVSTSQFSVDKATSQVIRTVTSIKYGNKTTEKEDNCTVIDNDNWSCGGGVKVHNGIEIYEAKIQNINGEIKQTDYVQKTHSKDGVTEFRVKGGWFVKH